VRETLSVVLAGGQGERLSPLTRHRAKPAVPFGGIYRIIDFTLSNIINSGLRRTFVLTQYKSASLERHIKLGWNIFSSELDEYIYSLPPQLRAGDYWYRGTADAIWQNLYSIDGERPQRVLILSGDHVYKMDYSEMIAFHKDNGAAVTIASFPVPIDEAKRFGVVVVDSERRVIDFQEKPPVPRPMPDDSTKALANMGVYLFEAHVLRRLVTEEAERVERGESSNLDFGKDILPRCVENERIFAFPFHGIAADEPAYWRDIGTLDSYYEASMDLVSVSPELNLYSKNWPLRTRPINLPPAKFVFGQDTPEGRIGVAIDSIVSSGTVISGGRVENSILGFKTRINSYARVSDSIIMDLVQVGRHAKIRRAIIDKGVEIPEGFEIGYDVEQDRKLFTVSDSGVVVIAKGTKIPVS
jgi:glucose-1-phosphate adenylyltransferase